MKRELYKRLSIQQIPQFGESSDEIHTIAINNALELWLKQDSKIEGYRIVNVNTFLDPKSSMPAGIQGAYTVIHIAYWLT